MKKKLLLTLTLLFVTLMLAFTLTACGEQSTDGLHYMLNPDNESYTVAGIGTAEDMDIIIPSEYKGKPITAIADSAFKECKTITSVSLPNSVKTIGNQAFSQCESLTSINFGEDSSLESIGHNSFYYCTSLTDVVIPAGITSIENGLFGSCSSLKSISIPSNVTMIDRNAFANCSSMTSIDIPNSITSIGYGVFNGCRSLVKVNYQGTIEQFIELGLMATTDGLYDLYINDQLITEVVLGATTKIPDLVFNRCKSIINITLGNDVTSIGYGAFYNCSSLSKVYYKGDAIDWNSIDIGYDNDELTNATRYYYIENEADVPSDGGNYWHYVDGAPTPWVKE